MCELLQSELDASSAGDNDNNVPVVGGTVPVSYVLVSGLHQNTAVAHSAPNELLNSRKNMTSPLSLGDRASTATSISEARTVQCIYLSFMLCDASFRVMTNHIILKVTHFAIFTIFYSDIITSTAMNLCDTCGYSCGINKSSSRLSYILHCLRMHSSS